VPSPSPASSRLNQDGCDTRGPKNALVASYNLKSTDPCVLPNDSDETALYAMNQAPSKGNIVVYTESWEKSGEALPDKYFHGHKHHQNKMNPSDSSVANLS